MKYVEQLSDEQYVELVELFLKELCIDSKKIISFQIRLEVAKQHYEVKLELKNKEENEIIFFYFRNYSLYVVKKSPIGTHHFENLRRAYFQDLYLSKMLEYFSTDYAYDYF